MAKPTAPDKKQIVEFQGARAVVWARGDGRWAVSWSQGRKARSTTRRKHEDALKAARKIVRDLAAGLGTRAVTIEDAETLAVLRRVCGERQPIAVLSELEDALRELRGVPLAKAVSHWKSSGMSEVERVTMRAARNRFLDDYESRSRYTRSGVRKEIDGFVNSRSGGICVCELTREILGEWIARPKLDGEKIGARFYNNRLATWMTFLNRCRSWGMWPRGEKHPAEMISKRTEPRVAVPIWTPQVARAVLALMQAESRRQVPYVVLGCWLGLRPTEITRVTWDAFDWHRGYLHLDHDVARKLQEERYVPLNAKARELLESWLRGEGLWIKALAGELRGKCCFVHDQSTVSVLARKRGIIDSWPQDVMRHSYISYRIALGHSKHEVAEAAGNSEAVIRKRYRRPLMREDGEQWFASVSA